jgi:hypothetical protein
MTTSTDSSPKKRLDKRSTEHRKKTFEPPMNTDEHRLKADQKQLHFIKIDFFSIMFLSVFIGVHRWLKKAIELFSQDLIGVCCL